MNNKRILVITNMYPTKKYSSFGIFVKNQVEALKKRNLQVDVAAITNPKSGKVNVMLKYVFWLLKTILILLTKGRKYHIIHAHYVFPSGFLALLFKRLYKTRLIVTAHGGDIDKMAKKSKRLFGLTKKILHEADHVIAVGQELQQQIITNFSVSKEKISIINMGVDRQIFKPAPKQLVREQCGIQNDSRMILFVGNLLEQKGLIELIDAMGFVHQTDPAVKLVLIGATKDPAFKQRLDYKINTMQLGPTIKFLGTKEQSEIALWMSAADCLVLPSHIEGFGLVALEAMACHTPVIGTNVGGLKYLLDNGAGKITPVKDSKALAQSIIEVLSSEATRNHFIINGTKKAGENDQETMLNRVMQVYFPTGG